YDFTATMEEALDAIARGEGEAEKWLHSFWFGNGQAGLKELVNEESLALIDPADVNAVHIGVDADGTEVLVRVWNNGASVVHGDADRGGGAVRPAQAPWPAHEAPHCRARSASRLGSGGPCPRRSVRALRDRRNHQCHDPSGGRPGGDRPRRRRRAPARAGSPR